MTTQPKILTPREINAAARKYRNDAVRGVYVRKNNKIIRVEKVRCEFDKWRYYSTTEHPRKRDWNGIDSFGQMFIQD